MNSTSNISRSLVAVTDADAVLSVQFDANSDVEAKSVVSSPDDLERDSAGVPSTSCTITHLYMTPELAATLGIVAIVAIVGMVGIIVIRNGVSIQIPVGIIG